MHPDLLPPTNLGGKHLRINGIALTWAKCQTTDSNQGKLRIGLILSSSTNGLLKVRAVLLYLGTPTAVPKHQ